MGTGLHPIDLLRFLLDSEIVEVHALCEPQPSANIVDEIIYLICKFTNGTTGIIISGMLFHTNNDVEIYGKNAKVLCKDTVGMVMEGKLIMESDSLRKCMSFSSDIPGFAIYVKVIDALNKCILDDTEPAVTGYDGLQMCRIATAILESSRQGKSIKIPKYRR